MFYLTYKSQLHKAFTLVELLLVITIIGVLAGVTLNIINTDTQKRIVQDSIRKTNLEKIVQGILAYEAAENGLPMASSGKPIGISTYIANWPGTDNITTPQAEYTYIYDKSTDANNFAVTVPETMGTSPYNYFKYRSSTGLISECKNETGVTTTVALCTALSAFSSGGGGSTESTCLGTQPTCADTVCCAGSTWTCCTGAQ